jgi:hypothetical protein
LFIEKPKPFENPEDKLNVKKVDNKAVNKNQKGQ